MLISSLFLQRRRSPARKAEKGVPTPFKPGERMHRPAKPACNKVKVRAPKRLKDMAKQRSEFRSVLLAVGGMQTLRA